jgi:hypothetical protein
VREYKAWLGEACKMVKNDRPNYTRIQDLIGRFRFMCTPEFRKKLQDSGIQWGKS